MFSDQSENYLTSVDVAPNSARQPCTYFPNVSAKLSVYGNISRSLRVWSSTSVRQYRLLSISARNVMLAVAPRHRQRFGGRNCVAQFLVPGHCNLVLVLSLGHYGAVLDLRKFLRFLG